MHACDTANAQHLDMLAEALLSRQVGWRRRQARLAAKLLCAAFTPQHSALPALRPTAFRFVASGTLFRPPARNTLVGNGAAAGLGGCPGLHPRSGPGRAGRQVGHRRCVMGQMSAPPTWDAAGGGSCRAGACGVHGPWTHHI